MLVAILAAMLEAILVAMLGSDIGGSHVSIKSDYDVHKDVDVGGVVEFIMRKKGLQ